MSIKLNYCLKDPRKEESLLILLCRWNCQQIKLSTRQRVIVATWDKTKQLCITSREKFPSRINRASKKVNDFLAKLTNQIVSFYDEGKNCDCNLMQAKNAIKELIDNLVDIDNAKEEKSKLTPTEFFSYYIEKKRIDHHTGRYISEKTKMHQRTVVKRLKKFLKDKKLPDTFDTFTSKSFDQKFSDWCYSIKNYKQNTIYATYGVLKPLLNAAKTEGFEFGDSYKTLKGKCNDVDAIYLTEDEIRRIYELDIPYLMAEGEIDTKSTIEKTRDLFIIACWTGLRRSDINKLEKATFNINSKTIAITPEKTKHPVLIPMHPMVFALYNKYKGVFPHLCDTGKTINHLRECARHAKINDEVRIVENRGGKVSTLIYKKYQLVGMHTGRRSFATNMYKRGFPTIAIMKLTGHTTETNFLKYIKITPEENALMMAEEFFKAQNPFDNE